MQKSIRHNAMAVVLVVLGTLPTYAAAPLAETTMLDIAAPSGWAISPDFVTLVQTKFEGDGALYLAGTANFARGFSRPLSGVVEIEQYIRIPVDGHVTVYVWEKNSTSCGPMWAIKSGQIMALAGNGQGSGQWIKTGVTVSADDWTKVVVEIDTTNRLWKLKLPDNKYTSDALKYRGAVRHLLQVNYLAESPAGVFIDAVRIRRTKLK